VTLYFVIGLVAVLAGLAVGFPFGRWHRKKYAEREIESAEKQALAIINEGQQRSEGLVREALVEAKEEIHRDRQEYDKEIKERNAELKRQERRIQQKEENYDKKLDSLEKKEAQLSVKHSEAEIIRTEAEKLKRSQMEILERISGFSPEEAKQYLIKNIEDEATHELGMKVKEVENRFKEEAEQKAREIVGFAIQKVAADHVAEATVSVVHLPNDEMKGRIIGREGRNIRALETLVGVDLIIDDTPEAITLSSFDPIRREVARMSLEKLIIDGRIHPTRIEEVVEKSRREIDTIVRSEGERATFETGVHGLHFDLIKLLGRMKFRTSYGQNVLQHSIEVALLSGALAAELGLDPMLAKRAGLLHDIGKATDHETEGTHVSIGVEIAKKHKEHADIIHAIHAHHGDVEPQTLMACIVQAADAISAARPGARRENIENYIKRLEKLEELACSFKGVEKSFAIQAGREIRIMVTPDIVDDGRMILLAREMSKKIEKDLEYPGQIKVHMIRETRHIEYAK